MIWDIFYFQPVFLSRFSAHPNSSTFDSKLDTVDTLFVLFSLMKHFLQKYLCHLREKRKHERCYIHGVIDSYNNVCFRWETDDLSSADEDVPTDDISVSSSSNSASPLNSEGKFKFLQQRYIFYQFYSFKFGTKSEKRSFDD